MASRWLSKLKMGGRFTQQLFRPRNIHTIQPAIRPSQRIFTKSSVFLAAGALTSGMYFTYQKNEFLCSSPESETQLLSHLGTMKTSVDAKSLLKRFQRMLDRIEDQRIDVEKLNELFHNSGFDDEELVQSIFDVMDWNGNGLLEPHEVSAVLTLLKSGSEKEKYEFLFYCIDLDHSGKVDKQEMRQMVRALLQARYHIHGLNDRWDTSESFTDIEPSEYRALAKYKSNKIVRDIFDYADTNRDGELNKKEFLRWCRRGGREVDLLTDILTKTLHHESA